MSENNVVKLAVRDTIIDPLTELPRSGAGQLIYQAVEAELLELLAEHVERWTEVGKAGVVRNGHLPARKLPMRKRPLICLSKRMSQSIRRLPSVCTKTERN